MWWWWVNLQVRETAPDVCTCCKFRVNRKKLCSNSTSQSKSLHVSCCFRQTNKAHLWLVPALDTDSYILTAYNLDALDTGSNKSAIVACNKLLKKHPKNILLKVINPMPLCFFVWNIHLYISSHWKHLPSFALRKSKSHSYFAMKFWNQSQQTMAY